MAVGDIVLNANVATVEVDATPHKITLDGAACSIVNVGDYPVYISQNSSGNLHRDGLQHNGEIELLPNDSIPLPADAKFIRHQCPDGVTSKLWYVPAAG